MALRTQCESSNEIGVFAALTNTYCLVAQLASANFYSAFEHELADHIPVVHTSVASGRVIGRMVAGNSRGLLVPGTATDQELLHLRNSLPDTVKVVRVEERLSALGNVIAAHDSVALLHHDVDQETEEVIQDCLGVETFRTSIHTNAMVGTYCVLNNNGAMVHAGTPQQYIGELATLLRVPVFSGTVNRGSSVLGGGMVVNDWCAFVGMTTTATEIATIEKAFKLRRAAVHSDPI